jgi:glycosyltransferase involved in cell wall biosynthesis
MSATPEPKVSAIITLHHEGMLAHLTLNSIERVRRHAEARAIPVELVIVLDRADEETRRIARRHPALRASDLLTEVDFGDLSLSRNHGISLARAECIGTFDGDDYFSENWVTTAWTYVQHYGPRTIVHPEMMIAFGALNAYWWQLDQTGAHYRAAAQLMINYWNACAFARREAFRDLPYVVARVGEAGFGFEDWHWNCETIAAGYVHRLALGTVRFERRKATGSLNAAHESVSAVIRPSAFFDRLDLLAPDAGMGPAR